MYSTDLSDARWKYIKKTLQYDNRKRKHSLRAIWNGILYLVKTGCQWRMLPSDFPKWHLVYYYYKKWVNTEQFDFLLQELRGKVRLKMGQKADPSLGIIDSQSVRWGNNRSLSRFDGNKKVKGVKRHVVVDKNGFLIAVMVSIANVHDAKAALLVMQVLKEMLCGIKIILADGGYRGEIINYIKKKFGYIIQVVLRSDKFKKRL